MERTFTTVIERDPESGWLIGDVVELPGCHTEAPDLQTLETNIREAISAYLQTVDLADYQHRGDSGAMSGGASPRLLYRVIAAPAATHDDFLSYAALGLPLPEGAPPNMADRCRVSRCMMRKNGRARSRCDSVWQVYRGP